MQSLLKAGLALELLRFDLGLRDLVAHGSTRHRIAET